MGGTMFKGHFIEGNGVLSSDICGDGHVERLWREYEEGGHQDVDWLDPNIAEVQIIRLLGDTGGYAMKDTFRVWDKQADGTWGTKKVVCNVYDVSYAWAKMKDGTTARLHFTTLYECSWTWPAGKAALRFLCMLVARNHGLNLKRDRPVMWDVMCQQFPGIPFSIQTM